MKRTSGKRLLAGLMCAGVILTLAGCGAGSGGSRWTDGSGAGDSSQDGNLEVSAEDTGYGTMGTGGGPGETSGSQDSGVRDARKLVETVNLEVETREFEQLMTALESRVGELGGYIESMNTYNGSRYSGEGAVRNASLTVRIPQGNLRGFLETVSNVGNIVRRSEDVKDVTLSYVDMESRRDTLRVEQSRLLEFLDKAQTVEEIITLEERLSEVRYQLESMESQLRTLDNLVDYSTVYISISEVQELTPVEEPTAGARVRDGFLKSLEDIRCGFVELGIWFAVKLPYFVLWGAVLFVVILLLRRRRRRLYGNKEEKKKDGPKENI